MKTGIIRRGAAALLMAAGLAASLCSCSDSWRNRKNGGDKTVLHLFIEEEEATRSSFTADESRLPDNALVLFYNIDGTLAFSRTADLEGLSGGSCEISGIPVDRDYYIYAIAGADFGGAEPESLFGTIAAARSFTLGKDYLEETSVIPLAFVPQGILHIEDGGHYGIPLQRIIAKYNFMIDKSGMVGNFTATSLTVRQSPVTTRPLAEVNYATSPAALCDGDAATQAEMLTLNEGGAVTCYLLENCFGNVCPGNSDPWGKVPDNMEDGIGALATYVEICGSYVGDNITVSGLKYRFFLGEDAVGNCDVKRNTVRSVTLCLSDENTVLKESWKVVRGNVEDGRSLSFDRDSVEILPYPSRIDTAFLDFSPSNLSVRVELDSSRLDSYPFSVIREGDMMLFRSERFIPQERTTAIFPVIVTTRDNTRRDTLWIAYRSLDEIAPYLPFELYTNFTGIVTDRYGFQNVLYKATAENRAYNGFCFKVDLDYNGVRKSCWSDIMVPDRDTVYETGLVVSSSDDGIISAALSATNPTLWYLTAQGLGTARITASYSMGGTTESGFSDVAAHVLDVILQAKANITRRESCNPSVRLFNEQGEEMFPHPDEVHYSSSNTEVLSAAGIGVNNGTANYNVRYGFAYPYNTVTDSREVVVSGTENVYELYLTPSGPQVIHAGESCRDSARIRHWIDGELVSDEEAFCFWNVSDRSVATVDSYGYSVTVTGKAGSATPLILTATHYCEDGNTYTAQKNILVMSRSLFIDRERLEWNHSESGAETARQINLTATSSLHWNAVISGPDAAQFSFSPTSGTGDGTIAVYPVSVNESRENDRNALITITADGVETRTITLVQFRDTTTPPPGPGPDPDPDPDPDPIVHDTTFVLTISPGGPVAIQHHGSCRFTASMQMYVDSVADGAPTDVTAAATWHSSNPSAATITNGLATGCNYSAEPASTIITAELNALVSNEVSLTVGGLSISRYLELQPSAPQTIEADGTLICTLLLHTVTDGVDDGGVNVTSAASWSSSNPAAATVSAGVATGCNSTYEPMTTTITASYGGMQNFLLLTVNGIDPVPVIHTLEISTPQTVYYLNGDAAGQNITVLYDGVPVTDASAISWNISNDAVISGISGFQPALSGPGTCTVQASYGGELSNVLNYTVGSLITNVRLEITAITITDAHNSQTYTGYLPPAIYTPGDNNYIDGETSEWCRITGGTYSDTDVTISVNLFITTVGGTEQLATSGSFIFGAMRGDIIPFTEEDWPDLINGKFFSFRAVINID